MGSVPHPQEFLSLEGQNPFYPGKEADSLLPMSGPPPSAPEFKQAFFDADPSFTPSHLRRLNNQTFSLKG